MDTNREKIIGISYARVACVNRGQKDGMARQEEENIKLLRSKGCTDIRMFKECVGECRMKEQKKLLEALNMAIEDGAKYFAVFDVSIISRNIADALTIQTRLDANNIELIPVKMSPEWKFSNSLLQVIAEYDRATRGRRISRGLRIRRENLKKII